MRSHMLPGVQSSLSWCLVHLEITTPCSTGLAFPISWDNEAVGNKHIHDSHNQLVLLITHYLMWVVHKSISNTRLVCTHTYTYTHTHTHTQDLTSRESVQYEADFQCSPASYNNNKHISCDGCSHTTNKKYNNNKTRK